MKYEVIKEYNDAPSAPIQISKGEELVGYNNDFKIKVELVCRICRIKYKY